MPDKVLLLGHMNSSGRVGDVPSGSSVETSDSRDGSRGKTSDVYRGGGRDAGVASVRAAIASISTQRVTIALISSIYIACNSITFPLSVPISTGPP